MATRKPSPPNESGDMARAYYHDSGCVRAEGQLRGDRAVGVWRFFDEQGALLAAADVTPCELSGDPDEILAEVRRRGTSARPVS